MNADMNRKGNYSHLGVHQDWRPTGRNTEIMQVQASERLDMNLAEQRP